MAQPECLKQDCHIFNRLLDNALHGGGELLSSEQQLQRILYQMQQTATGLRLPDCVIFQQLLAALKCIAQYNIIAMTIAF